MNKGRGECVGDASPTVGKEEIPNFPYFKPSFAHISGIVVYPIKHKSTDQCNEIGS